MADSKLEELGLAHLFVPGSKTWNGAEAILRLGPDAPFERTDITHRTGLAGSAIPLIVDRLREAGVKISSRRHPHTRKAVFEIEELPAPGAVRAAEPEPEGWAYITQDAGRAPQVFAEEMSVREGKAEVTVSSPLGRFHAVAEMTPSVGLLATRGLPLASIRFCPDGTQIWGLGLKDPVHLTQMRPAAV